MIQIKLQNCGIEMTGHAGYHINGQDIVCAAVSALTCSLINSIHNLTSDKIRAETDSGKTVIQWNTLTKEGKLLVDSWFLGMEAINQQYKCIEFI